MRARSFLRLLLPMMFLAVGAAGGDTTVLYQPVGTETPVSQGFGYIVNPPFGAQSTIVGSASGTTLDTTAAASESAGFFTRNPFNGAVYHPESPVLDRGAGFGLRFHLALTAESHNTMNRAGFSIIAIASDGRGIEIGFWTNEIWAYNDDLEGASNLFKRAEGVAQSPDAMAELRRYDLVVLGERYVLSIDGVPALAGRLRDYRNFVGPTFPIFGELDPYEKPNLIFLGDDTSSAAGRSVIGAVEVTVLRSGEVTILSSTVDESTFAMSWESLPGLRYRVDGSSDLGGWAAVEEIDASGTVASFSSPTGEADRFFYVVELEGIPE